MAMARASSGLAYPERFYAAASYAGFDGSAKDVSSKFKSDVALLLYGLYQQATIGPCSVPKPRAWSPVEQSKWQSWNGLGNMASTEAMRLFVKILEEEEPGWYSRVSDSVSEPVVDVAMNHNPKVAAVVENGQNGNVSPETKTVATDSVSMVETQDKDVISEGLGSVEVYDQWVAPPVSGQRPKPRYEVSAADVDREASPELDPQVEHADLMIEDNVMMQPAADADDEEAADDEFEPAPEPIPEPEMEIDLEPVEEAPMHADFVPHAPAMAPAAEFSWDDMFTRFAAWEIRQKAAQEATLARLIAVMEEAERGIMEKLDTADWSQYFARLPPPSDYP